MDQSKQNQIHPTAIVSPSAKIGVGNFIGPFCLIGPNVIIGDHNRFEAYVAIGTPGEHRDYFLKDPGPVIIGSHNILREYVCVTGGTIATTILGSYCVLMRGAHLGHDVVVKDRANLSWNVLIAGHTIIGHGANLGLSAVVHQRRVIGPYAMIGMNSTVTRNAAPFTISFGSPCKIQRLNTIGLQRAGVSDPELILFDQWFEELTEDASPLPVLGHEFSRFIEEYDNDCKSFEEPAKKTA